MDKKSYEIYLTKDVSAASLIGSALRAQNGGKEGLSVSWGAVGDNPRIPEIYHGEDWLCALVEYEAPENTRPLYHLKIC